MAVWLLDTNVLLRLQEDDPDYSSVAVEAVARLAESGAIVCVTPQTLIEFWCVATRPREVNGLGWDSNTATARVQALLDRFEMLEDDTAVFDVWWLLVRSHGVLGKRVHDARLVAVMQVHGVDGILTFNSADFAAFSEIRAENPAKVRP